MDTTDIVAWWGAALSTFVAAREYWLGRDRVKVELIHGVRSFEEGPCVVLRVKNYGKRPMMIEEVGLVWPWRPISFTEKVRDFAKYRHRWRLIVWSYGQLPEACGPYEVPKLIEPGHSLDLWVLIEELDRQSDEIRNVLVGYVRDGLDRRYYSGPFTLHRPPKGWRKKLSEKASE